MGNIKVLPEHVIAKIAAGEVVERPASVVKELLDNAIDAGAASIEVDVAEGGKKRIVIIDDGCGMDAKDANRCVERHATSKITSDADLFAVRTMGFRGEALSAIASVSKFTLETKMEGELEGTLVNVEGGVVKETRAAGCPKGTCVSVSDLFFNVPARKKFLKSDASEYGHIADAFCEAALANPSVRFHLSHGGETRILCSRTGDIKTRIGDVLGDDVSGALFEFGEKGDGIELKGFVVKGGVTRATAKDIHLFVNGRSIKDRIIQHALMSGFGTFLGRGEYPIAVLYLTIDPAAVDVNVHPTKREVRFANAAMVHDFVSLSVRKAVAGKAAREYVAYARSDGDAPVTSLCKGGAGRVDMLPLTPPYPSTLLRADKGGEELRLRVIGHLDRAFIVCEGEGGKLVLIDQHAAHERLGFEVLKEQLANGRVEVQRLLLPEQIDLSPKEKTVVMEHVKVIETAGFEIEDFGGGTIVIKAVPAILGDVSLKNIFEKMAAELSDFGSSGAVEGEIDKIFSVIACHSQVRAGDTLSFEEMRQLVMDIERSGISHCPHGRPATIEIERSEVEKWFKRS